MRFKFSLILSVIFILLVITNPSKNQYDNWINMHNDQLNTQNKNAIEFSDLIKKHFTIHQNYIVFSIYKLDVPQAYENDGVHYHLIGFFNHIYVLKFKIDYFDILHSQNSIF